MKEQILAYLQRILHWKDITENEADLRGLKINGPDGIGDSTWLKQVYDDMVKIMIRGHSFLLLCRQDSIPLRILKSHISNLRQAGVCPLLAFQALPVYHRECLMDMGVDFIILNKCIYLPSLYTVFEGSCMPQAPSSGKLSMLAQKIFLTNLYESHVNSRLVKDYASLMDVSSMAVSKAFSELEQILPEYIRKKGRTREFAKIPKQKKLDVYQRVRPNLSSPVKRVDTVIYSDVLDTLALSGETAFSSITWLMASDSCLDRRAIYYKDHRLDETLRHSPASISYSDGKKICQIERWSYIIDYDYKLEERSVHCKIVDPISLILSIEHEDPSILEEERYLIQRYELLEQILGN